MHGHTHPSRLGIGHRRRFDAIGRRTRERRGKGLFTAARRDPVGSRNTQDRFNASVRDLARLRTGGSPWARAICALQSPATFFPSQPRAAVYGHSCSYEISRPALAPANREPLTARQAHPQGSRRDLQNSMVGLSIYKGTEVQRRGSLARDPKNCAKVLAPPPILSIPQNPP